ncbi:replication initiation protein [Clostridium botulinum]|uniref:replication initiation protein n=1 Tax=Clostridium botulinum TaxID=1491 RepID=UPI001C9AEA15|nr:replication initiation protein [Clostridium botulinum]MBY6860824.1 replication initiation protein [Clostridium botulinum]MBY7043864.1 replication initiation protein [Clostridium botulinum]
MAINIQLNFLLNSNYDLSPEEQKIIFTLANMVQPNDADFKTYIFKVSYFIELFKLENEIELLKITKELMKKIIDIKQGNKIIQTSWLSTVDFEFENDIIELIFNPCLKPYMLQLKKNNIIFMKSKYSPRIYEILKYYKNQGSFEIHLNELKEILRIENLYPYYANFKSKVILPAKKDLKKNTDIYFDFKEIKMGQKVTGLKFIIHSKNSKENLFIKANETPLVENTIEREINLVMELTNYEFKEESIILFRTICNGDIELIKKAYKEMEPQKKYFGTSQKVDFMVRALKSKLE